MPPPRQVSELQQHTLWLSLAALWAAGSALAWLVAATSSTGWGGTSSGLVVLAALAAAVTLSLRLPILAPEASARTTSGHGVWLLTTCGTVNWLGCCTLLANHWQDALPPALILLLLEAWFHCQAYRTNALPWLNSWLNSWLNAWARASVRPMHNAAVYSAEACRDQSVPAGSKSVLIEAMDRRAALADESDEADSEMTDTDVERRTVQGLDEQGRRYLSGDIRVTLAEGQPSESLVISFCPAFCGDPQVDFECEAEEVTIQLVNCTPAGMRLTVRRHSSPTPLVFQLQWYAAEVESGDVSATSMVSGKLP